MPELSTQRTKATSVEFEGSFEECSETTITETTYTCLCDDGTSSFVFQHFLDTIKSLKEKVDSCRNSPGHARVLHDFIMVCSYVTSIRKRSKALRALELFSKSIEGSFFSIGKENATCLCLPMGTSLSCMKTISRIFTVMDHQNLS